MVNYQPSPLDRTFAALADPTRRALLARLDAQESLSVSELAKPFPVSLPAIMKHLDVLSDAGLVARSKTGRTVSCRLTARPMEQAMAWLDRYQRFWAGPLQRLPALVEKNSGPTPPQPSRSDRASRSNVVSMPRRRKSGPPGRARKK